MAPYALPALRTPCAVVAGVRQRRVRYLRPTGRGLESRGTRAETALVRAILSPLFLSCVRGEYLEKHVEEALADARRSAATG